MRHHWSMASPHPDKGGSIPGERVGSNSRYVATPRVVGSHFGLDAFPNVVGTVAIPAGEFGLRAGQLEKTESKRIALAKFEGKRLFEKNVVGHKKRRAMVVSAGVVDSMLEPSEGTAWWGAEMFEDMRSVLEDSLGIVVVPSTMAPAMEVLVVFAGPERFETGVRHATPPYLAGV